MCGILSILSLSFSPNLIPLEITEHIYDCFQLGQSRGPEFSALGRVKDNLIFGFHRLAINGLNSESNQPIIIDGIYLICNGEIYNYKILYKLMESLYDDLNGIPINKTDSDCEVIIHLYIRYGFEHMLRMLDGVFAIILYDSNIDKMFIARDYYGVRPLYYVQNNNYLNHGNNLQLVAFASEVKVLNEFSSEDYSIIHFPPSSYIELDCKSFEFITNKNMIKYYHRANSTFIYHPEVLTKTLEYPNIDNTTAIYPTLQGIRYYLTQAVYKRCAATDRPIACLLSGGLDSSLITALVVEYYRTQAINNEEPPPTIETYSIGLEDSEDIKYARIVAEYLGTNHTEIILSERDFIDAIPEVICAIESYDTTTVRASIGNYKLGEYISQNSDAKVIFNGDGSDELCGGYLYMENCPDYIEFDKETHRLLDEIYMYDVLRSDKCISSHGLEPRTPFLDKSWVQFYLAIPINLRMPIKNNYTKHLLRQSFSIYNCHDQIRQILPDEILWRKKEAFSDGVSKLSKSLYQIIQDAIPQGFENEDVNMSPLEREKKYYKNIFNTYYPYCNIISHYWEPKYTDTKEVSARALSNYKL
jgi:asparagine synthase (glutamine-hydrolysing)